MNDELEVLADTIERSDYIRKRVRTALERLSQDSLTWSKTPPVAFEVEPMWYEIRDAVISQLFEMDREQAEHERLAAEVVRECL